MLDTTPEAAEIQLRALRSIAPRDRLELAVDMSLTARAFLRARLQAEHPDWSVPELTRELLLRLHNGIALPPRPA
jgi:hypothetical protein